jgi:hypothetical protein
MFISMKQLWYSVFEQSRRQWATLLLVYVPPVIFLIVLTLQRGVPAHDLMADTASIANVPTYIGLVSNLGIILWGATVTICVFTMALLWRQSHWIKFFAGSAGLTLLLLLDDKFMIHDRILPQNNIPEGLYVGFYGLAFLAYTAAFWRFFQQTDYILLLLAVALLGFSVAVDVVGGQIQSIYYALLGYESVVLEAPVLADGLSSSQLENPSMAYSTGDTDNGWVPRGNLSQLAEDGTKFLGIIGWLLYFASVSRQQILHHMNTNLPPQPLYK